MPREPMRWSVPRDWAGEPCFILGGGESAKGFDAGILRRHVDRHGGRVIGVNEAGLSLAPWCDALYWADRRWLNWNHARLSLHSGNPRAAWKICRFAPEIETGFDIRVLPHSKAALSDDPTQLAGFCSGGAAINLAYLFGADPIVLLFFDMAGGNFHDRHAKPSDRGRYQTHFMPRIARMAAPLAAAGVRVINAWVGQSPVSRLGCFPMAPLAQVLDELAGGPPAANAVRGAADIRGLELTPARDLDAALARLAGSPAATVTIRLAGADVVTRRSADWWRRRLLQAWPAVVAAPANGVREAVFQCRR